MKRLAFLLLLLSSLGALADVTTQNYSVTFNCSGSAGPFPFTFPISASTAITVTKDGTPTSAYTISPVNNSYENGGNVTLNASCLLGSTLVLARVTPLTQSTVFTDNMPIPMKTIERSFDKLTEIAQEQYGDFGALGNWTCPLGFVAVGMANFLPQCASDSTTGSLVVSAAAFSGVDACAKIQAADNFIGGGTGTIVVGSALAGGNCATPPVLAKGHSIVFLDTATYNVALRCTDSTSDTTGTCDITCADKATLKLPNGANIDLISDTNFSTLTGGTSNYGLTRSRLGWGCTLDGNGANQSGTSYIVRTYGRGNSIQNATLQNAYSGAIWGEYAGTFNETTADLDFDGTLSHLKILFGQLTSSIAIINKGGIRGLLDIHSEGFNGGFMANYGAIERADSIQTDAGFGNGTSGGSFAAWREVANAGSTAIITNAQLCGGKYGFLAEAGSGGLTTMAGMVLCSNPSLGGSSIELHTSGFSIQGIVENGATGLKLASSSFGNNFNLKFSNNSVTAIDNSGSGGANIFNVNISVPAAATDVTGAFLGSDAVTLRSDGTVTRSLVQSGNSGYQGSGFAVINPTGGVQDNWTGQQRNKAGEWFAGNPAVGAGQTGDAGIVSGDTSGSGYLILRKPDGTNLGVLGQSAADVPLTLSNGAAFKVIGGPSTLVGAHSETLERGTLSEEITLSTSGTTTDSSANLLPATSRIEAVDCRVTVAITTATDWSIGDGSTPARFNAANSTVTLGATSASTGTAWTTGIASATTGMKQTAAAKLRITTTGTPGAGKIRCTVFYAQDSPPTS